MAGRPLRPATDRSLGGPLPRQQANRTQATPKAPRGFGPRAVCGISPSFPGLSPTSGHIPTRCSPVRHSPRGACDLHVLSIPPAFALSQDQTLKFITRNRAETRPRRRLSTGLRSPLSMRSALSDPGHAPTPPPSRDSTGRQGRKRALACFQKTYAAVKDQLPRTARSRRRSGPASPRGKEPCPKAQRS